LSEVATSPTLVALQILMGADGKVRWPGSCCYAGCSLLGCGEVLAVMTADGKARTIGDLCSAHKTLPRPTSLKPDVLERFNRVDPDLQLGFKKEPTGGS
jgi:hypothetical protein